MSTTFAEPSETTTTPSPLADLTGHDRCEQAGCNAQAYVRVQVNPAKSTLVFCGHDYAKHADHFVQMGYLIRDERARLTKSYIDVEATELAG